MEDLLQTYRNPMLEDAVESLMTLGFSRREAIAEINQSYLCHLIDDVNLN